MLSSPTPCKEQGYLQPDQVTQSLVQPDPECFQEQGTHHLFGPVPVPHHPHNKNVFLNSWDLRGPTYFQSLFSKQSPCLDAYKHMMQKSQKVA